MNTWERYELASITRTRCCGLSLELFWIPMATVLGLFLFVNDIMWVWGEKVIGKIRCRVARKVVCSSLTPFFIMLWNDGCGNRTAQVCTKDLLATMLMRRRRQDTGSNTKATTSGHKWGWNFCVFFNWALMIFSRVAVSRTMVNRTGEGACSAFNVMLLVSDNLWCQCLGRNFEMYNGASCLLLCCDTL